MLKVIIGVKGTGKTKQLIEMVNQSLDSTKGDVVCIEKGDKLRFEVKPQCRLINTKEYAIDDAEDLYGFVAGILASNHDVTDLFIDGALKISNNDTAAFEAFLKEADELTSKLNVNVVITSSIPTEEASDLVKKYI